MTTRRRCTECPNLLPEDSGARRLTCSDTCRSRRRRRQSKQMAERRAAADPLQAAGRQEVQDAIRDALREELVPVAREMITGEVLDSIGQLVTLSEHVVVALTEDLTQTEDTALRQKAYNTWLRYVMGTRAAVLPDGEKGDPRVIVSFGDMPASPQAAAAPASSGAAVLDVDGTELRQCDRCQQHKPEEEFRQGAARCLECQKELEQEVQERFG